MMKDEGAKEVAIKELEPDHLEFRAKASAKNLSLIKYWLQRVKGAVQTIFSGEEQEINDEIENLGREVRRLPREHIRKQRLANQEAEARIAKDAAEAESLAAKLEAERELILAEARRTNEEAEKTREERLSLKQRRLLELHNAIRELKKEGYELILSDDCDVMDIVRVRPSPHQQILDQTDRSPDK